MKCGQSLLHVAAVWRHNLLVQHAPSGSLYVQKLLRSQLLDVLHAVVYWWLRQPGLDVHTKLLTEQVRRAL